MTRGKKGGRWRCNRLGLDPGGGLCFRNDFRRPRARVVNVVWSWAARHDEDAACWRDRMGGQAAHGLARR